MVGVCSWTPDGVFGRIGTVVSGFLPTPPPPSPSPLDWGKPAAVNEFFSGLPVTLAMDHAAVEIAFASIEDAVVLFEQKSGPILGARDALEPAGSWPQARTAMAELFAEANVATDGTLQLHADYLVVLARRSV